MAEREPPDADSSPQDVSAPSRVLYRIATVAWLAITVGLVIQVLILASQLLSGAPFPGPEILANAAQDVTWSLIVCLGISIGTIVMRASSALVGLIGLACTPIALGAARGVQYGVNQLLGTPEEAVTFALLVVAVIKAFEYGFLGYMLARLVHLHYEHAPPYMMLGFGTGVGFGGLIVIVSWQLANYAGAPLALSAVIGLAINELLFPFFCVMVIFTAQYMDRQLRMMDELARRGQGR